MLQEVIQTWIYLSSSSSTPKIKLNTNGNTFFNGGNVTIDGNNLNR